MKVAALDLGTNTFLCLVAEVEGGRVTHIYQDEVRVVRLGQGVHETRKFHAEALARAKETLKEFAGIIQKENPQKILAMATSAARDVENAEELFQIGRDLGIPIQIIPGSREAEITFRGAVSGFSDKKRRLVVDIGGGSTELIVGQGGTYRAGESLDLGCVRLTEKFALISPVENADLDQVVHEIRSQLPHVVKTLEGFVGGIDEVLAVAGTPTEIARIEVGKFDREKIDGYSLSVEKLMEWQTKFQNSSKEDIIRLYGVHPGRADVILVGTLLLIETLLASGAKSLKVSTRGVRFGVALELVGK